MPLAVTHRGWENEHLATFLLSRVAFVASPKTVADDVGTDLFCTLYEHTTRNDVEVIVPRSSLAVQVKSSAESVNVAGRLDYLARLEIPYYLGIIDQQALTLDLFSARFLPALLSYRGRDRHRTLHLVPVDTFDRHYRPGNDQDGYKLLCHRVVTLRAGDDREATARASTSLQEDAAAGLKAIASRLNKEYVFDIPDGDVEIFMGPDSARTFRDSFFKRLAEALLNLAWLIDSAPPPVAEIDTYLAITDSIASVSPLPRYVQMAKATLLRQRAKMDQSPAPAT